MKPKIILASTSPRRSELLKQIGLEFEIMPSAYEEDMTLKMSHKNLAKTLAYGKAKDVAGKVKEGIVIGVDTFLILGSKRIGKPKDSQGAIKILEALSGKTIKVYSGVAIIDCATGREIIDYEITKVKFKKLTQKEIEHYVKTGEPLGKAGAFAIQGLGAILISSIKGCYSNVIGLPLHNLYKNLQKFGVDIFDYENVK